MHGVRLRIDVEDPTSPTGYGVFEMKRPWSELQATWNEYALGQSWSAEGGRGIGDKGPSILSPFSPRNLGLHEVSFNADGVALVQNWIDNPSSDNGIIIAYKSLNANQVQFQSRNQNPAADRPTLEITYQPSDVKQVDVKTFLEGRFPYSGTPEVMYTTLNQYGVIPLTQPYNTPPWDYPGTKSVTSMPPDVVDWVLVHLIDPSEPTIVATKAGLLDKYGNVSVLFTGVQSGQYRVAVDHRNHIGVLSASTIDLSGSSASYDFTEPGMAASDGSTPMKTRGEAKVMFGSDGEPDGQITAPDFNIWNAETTAGATGYRKSDYNMDRQVTAPDFNIWNPNTTAGAQMPKVLVCALYGKGCQSGQAEALATVEAYVRLNVTKDNGKAFWVDVEIRRDPGLALTNLGSAVVDMYYDNAEVTYSTSLPGDLGGLLTTTKFFSDDDGAYVRYQVRASGAIPVVPVGTDWELLVQHRFTRTPPPRPENASIRDVSLHLGFVENFPARIIRSVNVQVDGTAGKSDISEASSEEIPLEFSMDQNYPNPFNPVTQVSFGLPEKAHVKLAVFDMLGRAVRLQLDEDMEAGLHATTIDARDLPSGVYFFTIEAGAFRETRKMTVLR